MSIYKYYLYHTDVDDEAEAEALKLEYENIDTALHLFCRFKKHEPSAVADPDPIEPLKALVQITFFEVEEEAREFLEEFVVWLNSKNIPISFRPSIELKQKH